MRIGFHHASDLFPCPRRTTDYSHHHHAPHHSSARAALGLVPRRAQRIRDVEVNSLTRDFSICHQVRQFSASNNSAKQQRLSTSPLQVGVCRQCGQLCPFFAAEDVELALHLSLLDGSTPFVSFILWRFACVFDELVEFCLMILDNLQISFLLFQIS